MVLCDRDKPRKVAVVLPAIGPTVKPRQSVLPVSQVCELHRPAMRYCQNDCSPWTQDSSSLVQSCGLARCVFQHLGHDDGIEVSRGERQCLCSSAEESCSSSVPINSVLDVQAVDVQAIAVPTFVTKRRQQIPPRAPYL